MTIERQALAELSVAEAVTANDIVDTMVAFFNRRNDHETIREAVKSRYAIGIKDVKEPGAKATYETYTKEGVATQVDSGLTETIAIGFGQKIVSALATLTTEPGQTFTLTHETINDTSSAEEVLNVNREKGGFDVMLSDADIQSNQVGCSVSYLSWHGDAVKYDYLAPTAVAVFYSERVVDDGQTRAPDKLDLDDAYCVIIRLSQSDFNNYHHLAVFGRSEIYPQGRYVTYESAPNTFRVPEPYRDGAVEWEHNGKVANPLTVYSDLNPEKDVPEYPIAIIRGGITNAKLLLPTTTSLYDDAVEFDVASSHLLSNSQRASGGTLAISLDDQGVSRPLPRTIDGAMVLYPGQTAEFLQRDAAGTQQAMETLKDLMIHMASGYSVPDYMVVSEDHTVDASSGVAMEVKSKPLKKNRDLRVKQNTKEIDRIFRIEQALIWMFYEGDDAGKNLLAECDQEWNPGRLTMPESKKDKSARIKELKESGIYDEIEAIRDWYDLATDEEAIEIYNKRKDRAKEFPPLNKPEEPPAKKTFGLRGNNGQQQQ
jgi:hypothetical protein